MKKILKYRNIVKEYNKSDKMNITPIEQKEIKTLKINTIKNRRNINRKYRSTDVNIKEFFPNGSKIK